MRLTGISFILVFIFSFHYFHSNGQGKTIVAPVLSKIVIDPGHGGDDPGAVSDGIQEKDIVLDIALKVGKLISDTYPSIKVIYTRKSDVFIPLYERAEIANRNKADLFISIHANYFSKPGIHGTETFVLGLHRTEENLEVAKKENSVILLEKDYSTIYEGFDPNSPESYIMFELVQDEYLDQSIIIASSIQDQFTRYAHLEDRGVKQAGFIVLKRSAMPSVLVETGFITNLSDRKYLLSDTGQANISIAVLKAVSNFINKVEDKTGVMLAVKPEADDIHKHQVNKNTADPVKIQKPPQKQAQAAEKPSGSPETDKQYAVQIAASVKMIDLKPENFKSEKKISFKKIGVYYKFYSGTFGTIREAKFEMDRVKKKFPGAFIVVFEGDKVYPLKF
jgi:N-acetylmuramoyl-L-alanine amidase